MGDTEYVTMGNNVVSREPQYQFCSPRYCRERKRRNSCKSVHFSNENKQDETLKGNVTKNNQVLLNNDISISKYPKYFSLSECFSFLESSVIP